MTQFADLLRTLSNAGVEFIVIGGVAGAAHGAVRTTEDLDVVYRRTPENLNRILKAIAPLNPYPRGAPEGLPFKWDERTLRFGTNFTLRTVLGLIDLLGEVTGGPTYEELLPHSLEIDVFGIKCRCVELGKLIQLKRAAARAKDLIALSELETLHDEQQRPH